MIISFASGKGGTGKTTIATNFALFLSQEINPSKIQFLDCDVEEPNAAIFLKPQLTHSVSVGIPVPVVDFKKCTYCGKCAEVCVYHAIAVVNPVRYTQRKNERTNDIASRSNLSNEVKQNVLTFPELCHGCGGCTLFCPEQAISETNRELGLIEKGKTGVIEFIQGRLNIGEPMATPLIRELKKHALKQSPSNHSTIHPASVSRDGVQPFNHLTIIDVPPGTSCPVIEAVKGSDFSILVTEPTPFGLNDLILAVKTLQKLNIPFGVAINRDGIGDKGVEGYCKKNNISVLMRMPMDKEIAVAYSKGVPMIQFNSKYRMKFQNLYQKILEAINKKNKITKEK